MIVGWYNNATVYREARDGGVDLNGERHRYSAEARTEDAVLLPPVARNFNVRSSRTDPGAGFGQKPTWYGADAVDARVWAYIRSYGRSKRSAKPLVPPKNLDPQLRRKVEKAAVAHAAEYYTSEAGGQRHVVSVEPLARGWDLEASNGDGTLLVEVKGLLNSRLVCELTPNEYEKMMLPENRARYVVYVVTNALAQAPATPLASIFGNVGGKVWQTADGRSLLITEKKAAVLSCALRT
ncbi:MAG: hypothetical protein QOJ91_2522 [Sphingomonadales bacterium]|nr:hypothetical protein [Sphingomonadales bacterium]